MRRLAWLCACCAVLAAADAAHAATIDVVGLFPGKAVVAVDGGAPKSVAVGDTVAGAKLLAIHGDSATFLLDGRRETIAMGSYLAGKAGAGRATATLMPDGRGHFLADGTVNGVSTRFLVDTGATLVVLAARDADRMAIDYRHAPQSLANTANGQVPYRVVMLDRVKVGDVELNHVEAGVMEGGYSGPALLGMSFLSRTEVNRDGEAMVLTRRF